jgi:uncharacterized protein (DUF2062 family)
MKDLFKRYLPEKHTLHNNKYLRFLGHRLHTPGLWHMNRRSAAGAVAIGFFIAFTPLPMHTVITAIAAIVFRVNLPVSILAVWVNNPFTLAPMALMAYKTGAVLLGVPPQGIGFEFSWEWLKTTFAQHWEPLVLGCTVLGVLSAVGGYLGVRGLWRLYLVNKWRARQQQRQAKLPVSSN